MRVVLGRGPGKVWGEEGERSKKKSPAEGRKGKKKKGVCFTSPDLQQNCCSPRLHKMYRPATFAGLAKRGRARLTQPSLGPGEPLMDSQVNEYLLLSLPPRAAPAEQ